MGYMNGVCVLQNAQEQRADTAVKYEAVLDTIKEQEEGELSKVPGSIKTEAFLQDRKRIRVCPRPHGIWQDYQ